MLQLKVNWDVAILSTTNITGLGSIIRDAEGKVIATQCSGFIPALKPKLVEALAFRKSMLLAQDLCLSHVTFESDCQTIVKTANSSILSGTKLSPLIFIFNPCYKDPWGGK